MSDSKSEKIESLTAFIGQKVPGTFLGFRAVKSLYELRTATCDRGRWTRRLRYAPEAKGAWHLFVQIKR